MYATVCMVAGMDVVCYILYRWLHVRLRGVVSLIIGFAVVVAFVFCVDIAGAWWEVLPWFERW